MGLYGDIYKPDGTTIWRTYLQEIRRLSGNIRPETLSDNDIDAARASASEQVERLTRLENVSPVTEVELYNLMGEATNLFASSNCMAPMNDKQEARRVNAEEGMRICKAIKEGEVDTDISQDVTEPIISSDYATGSIASDGQGEGHFYVTKFAKEGGG